MTQPTPSLRTTLCATLNPADREDVRLGRHVEHDSRSKAYPARALPGERSRLWDHNAPVLDQGDLGACTGFATAQLLNCSAMALARRAASTAMGSPMAAMGRKDDNYLDANHAIKLYSRATQLDNFDGEYPNEDTGSSGLAVAKAAHEAGFLAEYRHAFGFPHFLAAVQMAPVIVGTWWYSDMGNLDRKYRAHAGGRLQGGHEYLCLGVNFDDELLTFLNSWGSDWGRRGRFYMTFYEFEQLLLDDGDATVLVGATPKRMEPEQGLHEAPDVKESNAGG